MNGKRARKLRKQAYLETIGTPMLRAVRYRQLKRKVNITGRSKRSGPPVPPIKWGRRR